MINLNELSTVARDEVKMLDTDLREVYADYGTNKLVLLKHNPNGSKVDDVYDQYVSKATYTPYPVIGMVSINNTDGNLTDVGEKMQPNTYKVTVLSSSITEQGLNNIT